MGLKVFIAIIYSVYCIHVLPAYILPKQEDGTLAVSDREQYVHNVTEAASTYRMKHAQPYNDIIKYDFVEKNHPNGN